MGRVNQYHIAKALNISQVTVSRALRGGNVSEETKRRVLAACEKLGYELHYTAHSLASGQTKNIVYAVEAFNNLSGEVTHAQLIGAGDVAMAGQYKVSIDLVDNMPRLAASGFMDGALVALHTPADHPAFMEWVRKTDLPVVMVDAPSDEPGVAGVRLDNLQAAFSITEYLLDLGHRDLVFFGLVQNSQLCAERYAGFLAAAQQRGARIRSVPINKWIERPEEVLHLREQVQAIAPFPTAFVASSDACATGLMYLWSMLGVKVPGDVSVVGFGNARWTHCTTPALTTVNLQGYQVGETAMRMLLRLMNGSTRRGVRRIQPQLVIRDSCAPPAVAISTLFTA